MTDEEKLELMMYRTIDLFKTDKITATQAVLQLFEAIAQYGMKKYELSEASLESGSHPQT